MQGNQPLDQRQAQANAVEFPVIITVDLDERLAKQKDAILGDADTRIADRDHQILAETCRIHGDNTTRLSEFNGVTNKIDQDLAHSARIGGQLAHIAANAAGELHALSCACKASMFSQS